jgi:hypothetical protein
MMGNPAVFGTATTREQADRVVEQLNRAGFTRSDIIVRLRDDAASREFTYEYSTRAPEAAAIGASAGTALGGMLCLLASVGALTTLGASLLIAIGPFAATIYGMVAGALIGGICGALVGLLIPEEHARVNRLAAPLGWVSVEARCTDAAAVRRATHVLRDQGVTDITTTFDELTEEVTPTPHRIGERELAHR